MSKSNRKDHRDREPSKGRNLDMLGMIVSGKGGPHEDRRSKRKSNPRNSWRYDDEGES